MYIEPFHRKSAARLFGGLIVSVVLVVLAMHFVDPRTAEWVKSVGLDKWADTAWLPQGIKLFGLYYWALLAIPIVWIAREFDFRAPALMLLAGVPALFNHLVKWTFGRLRPFKGEGITEFHFFRDGMHGLFHPKNFAFGSGHACQAFATATALAIIAPRYRYIFYAIALLVSIQRVAENAHYVSDSLAGAAIGVLGVSALSLLLPKNQPVKIVDPKYGNREAWLSLQKGNSPMPAQQPDQPYVSLVIPCYNEEESVPTLLTRVENSLKQTGRLFEVVLVDDGSSDKTPQLLADAMQTRPWLRVVKMMKNSGQSAAFEAGFAAARGEVIATIDADLQNDPEEIPRLLPMLDEFKVDMITGWRKDRQDTKFRKWQSRKANQIRNWISQETVNDSASSLKLYRAHAIKGLKLFNGAHRFFPTLVKMRGFTCHETPVKHSQRFAGTAKYGFRNRAFRAFIDLLAVRWMKSRYLRYEATESKLRET